MSLKVHPPVRNAYDFDLVGDQAEEQDMRAHGVFAVTRTDVIARAAPGWIVGDDVHCCMNL